MPDPNEERLKYLFNTSAIEVPQAKEGDKRTFKGTAYSGGRVDGHWYWGRTGVVFDLEGIEIDSPTALLEEHFGSNRIGVVKKVDTNGKIDVEGHFLTNERAKEIVQDSDDEFPFQMSMFIDPGSVEEVNTGQTVVVNGQSFTGPIAVFVTTVFVNSRSALPVLIGIHQSKPSQANLTPINHQKRTQT